jgi:hypothetical protein
MKPLTVADLDPLLTLIASETRKWVSETLAQRDAEISALKIAVATLQERPPNMTYKGIWLSNEAYTAGDVTTFDGHMWYAKTASTGVRPGSSPAWQLCVRAGRDLRDRGRRPDRDASDRATTESYDVR